MSTYKTKLVQIGNSRGVRIPKTLLSQVGLESGVEIATEGNALVIRSAKRARDGWTDQFKAAPESGKARLMDELTATKWDKTEWTW